MRDFSQQSECIIDKKNALAPRAPILSRAPEVAEIVGKNAAGQLRTAHSSIEIRSDGFLRDRPSPEAFNLSTIDKLPNASSRQLVSELTSWSSGTLTRSTAPAVLAASPKAQR